MKELIKQLTQIPGPSGYESAIRETIREIIKPYVRETRVDAMGNLIAQVGTKAPGGMRVMVAAHMDEIGLIVSHIEKKGLVRFTARRPMTAFLFWVPGRAPAGAGIGR